jgi:hypothetical protein
MPLNSSGQLSLGGATAGESVNLELGKAATALITMNDTDLRTLFGIGAGAVSMSNGYGKSSWTADSTRGYFGGGGGYPFVIAAMVPLVDRFTFATEAMATISATLPFVTQTIGVTGHNNASKGYSTMIAAQGGIQSIRFSDETTADIAADLPRQVTGQGEFQSAAKGYTGGGTLFPGNLNQISAITFSTETYATLGAVAALTLTLSGAANSQDRGYWAGGTQNNAPLSAEIQGLIFSTESAINPAASLVQGRGSPRAVNSTTRGYFGGGGSYFNQIDGIIFASETTIDPAAGLVQGRGSPTPINSATRGYFAGGTIGPENSSQIDGIQFSTETTIDPATGLTNGRQQGPFGVNNSNN